MTAQPDDPARVVVTAPPDDPARVVERLASCRAPYLIGVRHHSPILAAAMPALLEAAGPERLYVELPADLGHWLPWLADPGTRAPVALAAVRGDGTELGFWPFADFSPELAAIRWARQHSIEVEAFDLPVGARRDAADEGVATEQPTPSITARMGQRFHTADSGELWDRMIESAGYGAEPERVRRAALTFGVATRASSSTVDGQTLAREAYMRSRLLVGPIGRSVAVVGAYHAPALLDVTAPSGNATPPPEARQEVVTSLVPYAFELLDSRSGYPAGIRDPAWQQAVVRAGGWPAAVVDAATAAIVEICARLRRAGHVAGVPDAREVVRLSLDLARLRDLPAPGRREVVEAIQTGLAQGELLGRGRAVANAAEAVLVGDRRGRLASGTPRSGLAPHVEGLLAELGLPGPADPRRDLRLDPLRSERDRAREVALCRLAACGVPYGAPIDGVGAGGVATLGSRWRAGWQPATSAMVELAGVRGVTLDRAAAGAIRARETAAARHDGTSPGLMLELTATAARCGLPELTGAYADHLVGPFLTDAGLADLVSAHGLLARIAAGHVPGLPRWSGPGPQPLLAATVAAVEGIAGSDDIADARALLATVSLAGASARLGHVLRRMAGSGPASPLMQGAAAAALVVLGERDATEFGARAGSWVDGAVDADGRRALTARLSGTLTMAGPLLESSPAALGGVAARIEALSDDAFLSRLPSLRGGFAVLGPADRQRFLDAVLDLAEARLRVDADPALLAVWAAADAAGRAAITGHAVPAPNTPPAVDPHDEVRDGAGDTREMTYSRDDRWRLVLGRYDARTVARHATAVRALDELYGHGRGEGAAEAGSRGGNEAPYPTAREWAAELEDLFGAAVREEVLADAAAHGRVDAILAADPDKIVPSVDLLCRVLSLAGALPESHLPRLRRLVQRVVAELTARLASALRPALTGLATPRPTRRPGGPVDLRRTIRANLRTARMDADGATLIVPERVYFATRARRSVRWHVVLVVDVSGSMEPSTVYSALVAAILAGIPALSVRFYAFSTQVIDLSAHAHDPLSLLLEVRVGGGTDIGAALRYARDQLVVPQRTIVALVSDFEEGGEVHRLVTEIRALVGSGAHVLGLAALDERGAPRFNRAVAGQVSAAGMRVAALSPLELARWIGDRVRG